MPYCSRIFAYSVASASAPRAMPTRSAVVATRASACQRVAASARRAHRAARRRPTTSATVRVRSAPALRVAEIGGAAPWCRQAPGRAGSHGRRSPRSPTDDASPDRRRRRACRVRSSASTGPRNGASTSPRPNSSATMATSTPEASSERSDRQPVGIDLLVQPRDSALVVEIGDRAGTEIVGQLGRRIAQLLLFTGQTYIHGAPSAHDATPCPRAGVEFRGRRRSRRGRL